MRSRTPTWQATAQRDRRSGWGRIVGAVAGFATVVAGVALPAAVASAAEGEPGDSVYIGQYKIGYGGTGLFQIWEGSKPSDPDETADFLAYCIEHDVSAAFDAEGHVGGLDSFLGENNFADPDVQGTVFWLLAHSYPGLSLEEFGAAVGVPDISEDDAIEATQYAIWRYTELDWDAPWPFETEDSEAAYWYLVNAANASDGLTPEDVEVTASVTAPPAEQEAGALIGPFVVHTNQPIVAVSVDSGIAVTDAGGDAVDTDAVVDGQELYLDLRDEVAAGNATVRVEAAGSSATGKVVSVPTRIGGTPTVDDHAQSIILVAPHTARTSDEATVAWHAQDRDEVVVPVAPSSDTDVECGVEASIVLPEQEGVDYEQTREGDVVTVVATAEDGYVLDEGAQAEWRFTIPAAVDCAVGEIPDDESAEERPDDEPSEEPANDRDVTGDDPGDSADGADELAVTGAGNVGAIGAGAALLLVIGGAIVIGARRRSRA